MRSIILPLIFILCSIVSFAQRAQRLMIGVQADLIKSDNDGFFEKLQGGIEGNYYFSRKFSATAGVEAWTGDRVSMVVGARVCPIDEAFFRIRALPGKDFSIGAGFGKFLSENVRVEAMSDFYLEGHIAIRAGIAFGIGKRP
ncbi:MAG: hypothetical protein WD824_21970 [Cyclobacteriaceae bacterium]